MLACVAPMLFAVFVWWFSTGAVLYLVRLPRTTFRWSVFIGVAVLLASLYGLARTSEDATQAGAYLAFSYALLVWGALEIAFLTGVLTGPWKEPCPKGCSGLKRTYYAIGAILYHELALIAAGTAIMSATWGAANQIGAWTFLLLWAMRLSAKLNLFLGVRFLNAEFLPEHLKFVASFFKKKEMNALFPISVTLSTIAAVLMVERAVAASATPFETAGFGLLAALMALAILEHWFMVLPLPVVAMWKWGLRPPPAENAPPPAIVVPLEPARAVHAASPADHSLSSRATNVHPHPVLSARRRPS